MLYMTAYYSNGIITQHYHGVSFCIFGKSCLSINLHPLLWLPSTNFYMIQYKEKKLYVNIMYLLDEEFNTLAALDERCPGSR
jgi:hypothetical protein